MIIQPARTKKQYQLTGLRLRANKLGCQIFIHFNLTDTELLLLENLLRVGFHKDSKEKGDITTTAAAVDTAVVNVIYDAVAGSILNSWGWCH
jgi:hypothetical protein